MSKKNFITGERGFSTLLQTTVIAGALMGATEVLQKVQSDKNNAPLEGQLETANISARDQLALLLGNGLVSVSSDGKAFISGQGLPTKFVQEMTKNRVYTGGEWAVVGGNFTVSSCYQPKIDGATFQDTDSPNVAKVETVCGSLLTEDKKITTVIKPKERITNEHPSKPGQFVYAEMVEATTTGGSPKKSFKVKARITFLDPTVQCDTTNEKNHDICSADHCRFMMPKRKNNDSKGDVEYTRTNDGKLQMSLTPNPNYFEPIWLKIPDKIPPVSAFVSQEVGLTPYPKSLEQFVFEATKQGLKNPFTEDQGVRGDYYQISYIDDKLKDNKGRVKFQIPANATADSKLDLEGAAADPKARLTFHGYLVYHGEGGRGSLEEKEWPGDSQANRDELHNGCVRTAHLDEADFCSKVSLVYGSYTYVYNAKRRCSYKGPSIPGYSKTDIKTRFEIEWFPALKGGQRATVSDYVETPDLFTPGAWKASTATATGISLADSSNQALAAKWTVFRYVISKEGATTSALEYDGRQNIAPYVDPPEFGHHTPDARTNLSDPGGKAGFAFSNIWIAVFKLKQVDVNEKFGLPGDDLLTPFKERLATLKWMPECYITEAPYLHENKYKIDKIFDKCYYIAYYHAWDKRDCTFESPDNPDVFECRNLNGCFAKGTTVLMKDGTSKNIETIRRGDFVYNPITRKSVEVLEVVVGPENKSMIELTYKGGKKLLATTLHPFVTRAGLKQAQDLKLEDELFDDVLGFVSIEKISPTPAEDDRVVWNLRLADELAQNPLEKEQQHFFVAGGVISGDFQIQTEGYSKELAEKLSTLGW